MHKLIHLQKGTVTHSADGQPRGFIDAPVLSQLWIHTGTACNLRCPTCFEQAGPGNTRIQSIRGSETLPYIRTAALLGVQNFGITGGEPFMNPDIMQIISDALKVAPCLVLSNGMAPLRGKLDVLDELPHKQQLTIRISLDYPDACRHDSERGQGSFSLALNTLRQLHERGFNIAVARRMDNGETPKVIHSQYAALFQAHGLPAQLPITAFPNLNGMVDSPEITEHCMRVYHTSTSRASFMCAYSRMLVKKNGTLSIYACTLVDDDPAYNYGRDLRNAVSSRTLLRHRRCFTCFSNGVSCGG